MRAIRSTVLVAFVCGAMAVSAGATTYVMMKDADLADQAPIIAVVRVAAADAAPRDTALTAYRVTVERPLKGDVHGELTVMVPGGVVRDGRRLTVFGAPTFQVGERALLFLEPHTDGSYRILHLMLGAFHERTAGDRTLAVRNFEETTQVSGRGAAVEPEGVRDFEQFGDWLAARANGATPSHSGYVVPHLSLADPVTGAIEPWGPQPFTLLNNMRWFVFDSGSTVFWFSGSPAQVGNPGGATQAQAALQAWINDPDTPIDFRYGGTASNSGGLRVPDDLNNILWNDPNGEIGGSFNCSAGGVLAIGGSWLSGSGTWKGSSYWRIVESDIVVQDGSGCYFAANGGTNGQETLGHEIGHTIGLGHSCEQFGAPCDTTLKDEALMRWSAHGDGRGALLGADDRAGIRLLYQPPVVPAISISDAVVIEGNAGSVSASFAVRLNIPSYTTVSVNFSTANGTAEGIFLDYYSTSGTVRFYPGETVKTIAVRIGTDTLQEPNETFYVNLSVPIFGTIADGQGIGTIIDDDAPIANPATVYRLRHPSIGSYLFTVYPYERDSAQLQYGYVLEGVCCKWSITSAPERWPLYRLWSGSAGEYFFTIYPGERDTAVAQFGYVYEGIAAYCGATSFGTATTPWYRLRLGNKHIYTIFASERDDAVARYGYTYEGVSCYLPN